MKKIGMLMFVSVMCIGLQQCQNKKENAAVEEVGASTDEMQKQEGATKLATPDSLIGIYEGGYPWEEEGKAVVYVHVTILLQEGNKYVYTSKSDNEEYVEKGEWERDGDRLYLRENEDSAARGYIIRGTSLHEYDTEGEIVNNEKDGDNIYQKLK
ncbi:MAG: hypothetical protein LBE34_16290 [Flavobacteriaceae bacterium]|jgi:hypothetical protein|nr:hypothetical protein [Flavobacteriaceae bacterium]